MIDAAYRLAYRLGYRVARLVWRLRGAENHGAIVAIRVGDRLLLIRNSYRREWTLPGGGVRAGEAAEVTAAREIGEELGLALRPEALVPIGRHSLHWHDRQDTVSFFEARLPTEPAVAVDRREVVEARFFALAEALALGPLLQPHVRDLLEGRVPPP